MNRNWCFTLNNPDGLLDLIDWQSNGLRYCIYQEEIGEEGTNHFQGYLELDRTQRISALQKRIPGAHFEPRRGTQQQAIEYCKKPGALGGPYEIGVPAEGQGTRSDVKALKEMLDSGATDEAIWDALPAQYLRYERMFNKVRAMKSKPRNFKTETIVLWGKPRQGKSTWCNLNYPIESTYWKPCFSIWFDGYNPLVHTTVIVDEWKAWLPWHLLLQLMDRFPCMVQTKFGYVNFCPKTIVFTTNFLPTDWYNSKDDNNNKYPLEALLDRVDTWKIFSRTNTEVQIRNFEEYDDFIHAAVNFQHPADRQPTNVIDISSEEEV